MRWEESVLAMFDDLEMQAEGLHLVERAVEVEELGVAKFAEVELVGRLHGSIGSALRVGLVDGLELQGRLAGAGTDWMLIDDDQGGEWFVHLSAVSVVLGLGQRSVPSSALRVSARLSIRSVLRAVADDRQPCVVRLHGGRTLHGNLTRVGADFAELRQADVGARVVTVPLTAIAVVQGQA
jgi:hypothetical protein